MTSKKRIPQQKRSAILARIHDVMATTLEHDCHGLGAEWVDELAEELAVPRQAVVDEADKISASFRTSADANRKLNDGDVAAKQEAGPKNEAGG